jgi:hypothetical protein
MCYKFPAVLATSWHGIGPSFPGTEEAMKNTYPPLEASRLDSARHARPRGPVVRLIGPIEPLCPPLRLVTLRGIRIVQLHQPEVVLGRHSEADFQLLEPDVSRFHCRFVCVDDQWEIEDLNSLNGTFVNGEPVQRQRLAQSDVIRIADFLFQVDLGAPRELSMAAHQAEQRSRHVLQSIAALLPYDQEDADQRRRSA